MAFEGVKKKAEELRKGVADFVRKRAKKAREKKKKADKKSGPLGREVGRGITEIIRRK